MPDRVAVVSASVAASTIFLAGLAFQPRSGSGADGDTDWTTRRLLAGAGSSLIAIGVGGTAALRAGLRLTPKGPVRADQPVMIPTDATFQEVAGLSPRVTLPADHYVVDIDIENRSSATAATHDDTRD